jgi:hypothetical protein
MPTLRRVKREADTPGAAVGSVRASGLFHDASDRLANTLDRLLWRRPVLVATLVGCVIYLAAASSPTTGLWSHRFTGDVDVYEFYAQKLRDGEVPIRDFPIEYPPASLVVFIPPMLAKEALQHAGIAGLTYTDLFKAAMLICGLLIVFIVASTANFLWSDPRRVLAATVVVGVSPLALGPIALSWYDMWPTLLTIATVALFVRRQLTAAFALLGFAIAAKLFALVLLPLLLVQALRTLGWKRTLTALAAFLVITAICFGSAAILSLRGARYPFTYLIDRPVEIESTAGSIVGLEHIAGWRHARTRESYGSVNFKGSHAADLGLTIAIAGAVALLALWWQSALVRLAPEALIARCAAAIAIALACSKVFSPQYLVWLVPFVALALRRAALLMLAVAVVLTRVWFPEHWQSFNNIPPMFALAAPRNLAVCLLAILLIFGRGTRDPSSPRAAPADGRLSRSRNLRQISARPN